MFIAQILHIPGAEQCRCPEKFIEIFGFCERTKFWTFWFWHADSWARCCCRCSLHSSSVRRCEICRNRARSDSSRTSARLWTSPPSPPCLPPTCLPRMSCVLSIQEPAVPSVCLGSPGSLSSSSSGSRSIKLGKSEKLNGSIGPEFIGPSFAVDSADWSHCRIQKLLLHNHSRQRGPLKVTKLKKARKIGTNLVGSKLKESFYSSIRACRVQDIMQIVSKGNTVGMFSDKMHYVLLVTVGC